MSESNKVGWNAPVIYGVEEIRAATAALVAVIEKRAINPELKAKALLDTKTAQISAVKSLFSNRK